MVGTRPAWCGFQTSSSGQGGRYETPAELKYIIYRLSKEGMFL